MQDTVGHATWCDRFHEVIGTPECSTLVDDIAGVGVMVFGDATRGRVAVVGANEQPVAFFPNALVAALEGAGRIARS